jgi:hypothetical protein
VYLMRSASARKSAKPPLTKGRTCPQPEYQRCPTTRVSTASHNQSINGAPQRIHGAPQPEYQRRPTTHQRRPQRINGAHNQSINGVMPNLISSHLRGQHQHTTINNNNNDNQPPTHPTNQPTTQSPNQPTDRPTDRPIN